MKKAKLEKEKEEARKARQRELDAARPVANPNGTALPAVIVLPPPVPN